MSAAMDDDGLIVSELAPRLRGLARKPRLICSQPNFQNPSGVSLSLPRRRELMALAAEQRIPVVEDDPYAELLYDGEALPPLKAMDTEGQVVYLAVSPAVSPLRNWDGLVPLFKRLLAEHKIALSPGLILNQLGANNAYSGYPYGPGSGTLRRVDVPPDAPVRKHGPPRVAPARSARCTRIAAAIIRLVSSRFRNLPAFLLS